MPESTIENIVYGFFNTLQKISLFQSSIEGSMALTSDVTKISNKLFKMYVDEALKGSCEYLDLKTGEYTEIKEEEEDTLEVVE